MYRPEHPNPQWERKTWRNLNGEWEFDFDFANTAAARGLVSGGALPKTITVPFCPESELSGIGYRDFISGVCYRKTITLDEDELSGRVHLHFGAVDYRCDVYFNGQHVSTHVGGYVSFHIDVTPYAKVGENVIFLIVEDHGRAPEQPTGKQCEQYKPNGCFYTRTTGIWQTVWLEFLPTDYIESVKFYPNAKHGSLTMMGGVCGCGALSVCISYEGKLLCEYTEDSVKGRFELHFDLPEIHLWEAGQGRLYDVQLCFGEDAVSSYFGLRDVALEGRKFTLNGKCLFQRFVLDQGFYPEGIYTAVSDEQLKKDIELSMAMGFNGARLHQKMFEPRFLYHCDKAGYLVWGEHGNYGLGYTNAIGAENFMCEWMECLERDFNHPSIIGWCPFNETWGYYETRTRHRLLETVWRITKAADSTRPCIATSGNYHPWCMEIHDVHDYCNDFETFRDGYAHIAEGRVIDQIERRERGLQKYVQGRPIFVSEYGGFPWIEDGEGWGYGDKLASKEAVIEKYRNYTNVLLDTPDIMGFCYTQLYDVEQEKNGLYTYERTPKFDPEIIKSINTRRAAIEEE